MFAIIVFTNFYQALGIRFKKLLSQLESNLKPIEALEIEILLHKVLFESLVQRLALKKFLNCVPLQGISTVKAETKYSVTVQIPSMTTDYSATLNCAVLPRIVGNVPRVEHSSRSTKIQDRLPPIFAKHETRVDSVRPIANLKYSSNCSTRIYCQKL
ncbi:hypothetical protein PR048_002345 [Dryococelus australis]|uniref:Uncharacterized protein n=1 Tax=Dryococelus australis TaxID=614101 RepID=A0ABQ9IK16_9NEOP|nr:hypothetical protein PR048_002345 [Dryococelus australis]